MHAEHMLGIFTTFNNCELYFIKALASDYTKQLHAATFYMLSDNSGRDIVLCFDSYSMGPLLPHPHTYSLFHSST